MKTQHYIPNKIFTLQQLLQKVNAWRLLGKKIVLTNGVFDVMHRGHIASLNEAASHGEVLIVALNSDESVKQLKGPTRPINDEQSRAYLLANLVMVDAVCIFSDDTPLQIIKTILPDVLVKGGDYTIEQIAGAKEVIANNGKVILAQIVDGISSSIIIDKLNL
jgi:D-glycero-beta-D-manno-heptose 1-phosphate adenylyltransferase